MARLTFWVKYFFAIEGLLCIRGCFALLLISSHWVPVTSLSLSLAAATQNVYRCCQLFPGGQISLCWEPQALSISSTHTGRFLRIRLLTMGVGNQAQRLSPLLRICGWGVPGNSRKLEMHAVWKQEADIWVPVLSLTVCATSILALNLSEPQSLNGFKGSKTSPPWIFLPSSPPKHCQEN